MKKANPLVRNICRIDAGNVLNLFADTFGPNAIKSEQYFQHVTYTNLARLDNPDMAVAFGIVLRKAGERANELGHGSVTTGDKCRLWSLLATLYKSVPSVILPGGYRFDVPVAVLAALAALAV